jgi:hypothetical protein
VLVAGEHPLEHGHRPGRLGHQPTQRRAVRAALQGLSQVDRSAERSSSGQLTAPLLLEQRQRLLIGAIALAFCLAP